MILVTTKVSFKIKKIEKCYFSFSAVQRQARSERGANRGRFMSFAPSPDRRVSYPPRSPEKHEKIIHVLQAKDSAKIDIN